MRRVVVTGLGVVAPNGIGVPAFVQALRDGASGIKFYQRLADLNFACQVMGIPEVADDALANVLTLEQLRATNSCMRFAALAGTECWRDAGLPWQMGVPSIGPDWQTGVLFGNGLGGMDTIADKVVPLTSSGQLRRMGSTAAEQVMSSNTSALLGGLLGAAVTYPATAVRAPPGPRPWSTRSGKFATAMPSACLPAPAKAAPNTPPRASTPCASPPADLMRRPNAHRGL